MSDIKTAHDFLSVCANMDGYMPNGQPIAVVARAVLAAATPGQVDAVRDAALEEAATVCENEICTCCWDADAQAAAEHLAAAVRALKSASVSEQKGE